MGIDEGPFQNIVSIFKEEGSEFVISGSALGQNEIGIKGGGSQIIITLLAGNWVTAGATFEAERQNIIDGLTSAQTETTGWNNEVRDNLAVTTVVRTSDTVVTISLSPQSGYDITADEFITVTVPGTALDTDIGGEGLPLVNILTYVDCSMPDDVDFATGDWEHTLENIAIVGGDEQLRFGDCGAGEDDFWSTLVTDDFKGEISIPNIGFGLDCGPGYTFKNSNTRYTVYVGPSIEDPPSTTTIINANSRALWVIQWRRDNVLLSCGGTPAMTCIVGIGGANPCPNDNTIFSDEGATVGDDIYYRSP